MKRKVAAINDDGDYVSPGLGFSPNELGFNSFIDTVTLYVEAVDVSSDVADLEIKVEIGWEPPGGGEVEYSLTDFVRVTALNLSLMNVDENNNVTKARYVETSMATPVVTVNSVSVSQVQPSGDAQYIVGTLNLAGSIASAIQDIKPISANQNISEVLVYLNDSEDPIRIVAATYSKTANPNSFLHPFPYAGTFSGSVPNVTLLEGVNVIRVVAKDPVDDGEGFAEFCFEVQGISPAAQGAGIVASLDVELAASLSATSVDTITATLTVPGTGSVVDETLTETAADSRVFANAGGTFQIQITTSGETLDPAQVDEIYAVAIETTLGVTELAFPFMQETGDDTKLFHKDLYWSDEDADDYTDFVFALSQISALTASDGGVFKPYVLQVQGPDLFLSYMEYIVLDDGPRRIEQSPIDGKYYVRMKNSPSVVLQFNGKHADSGEPNANAMLSYLGDSTSCLWAFTRGFGAGGWSMVEGTWGLLQFGVDMSVWYSPQMITWRLSIGDTFETEKRFISTTAKTVKQVGEMVQQIQQDQDDIMVALLSGNWQEAADISLPYRLGMEYTGELLVALAQETWNLPLKEQCFYTGRATFEIAGLAVAWAKAGKLSQFGKLEFLNELRAVPFFATGRGAGAFTRIEQLLTRLVGATACFPPGTQIETRNGPKPIETIVPGDYVLSRCPETGLTDYRRVNRVFANRAPYLVHVTYRPRETRGEPPPVKDGLSSSDDEDACAGWRTIAATPEHPFYAHNRKEFVRAAELQPGDVFTSSEDRAFEVVGTEREQAPNVTAFTVHNFEVDAFHTYFVGDDRLWVHNACGGNFHSVYSLYLRYVQKQGKTPEEAFKLVEGFRKIARHNIKDGDIGRVLDEVLRTDTFPGVQTPLWTKGKYGHPGENMWKHYLDHVVDNKSNFPGREFPNIDNAVDYIKAARGFVDNFGTGSDWKRWTRVRNGVSEEVFVRKSTREFSPVIRSGTENGASKTYFRVHPTEDLRDYAIRNDYDEAVNGPW